MWAYKESKMIPTYKLSERYQKVLTLVVERYIQYAEPVGSRIISKRLKPPLSPATVRNIMADLEELGLLKQPYVSAGRIPTEEGFRYYVKNLLHYVELPENTKEKISQSLEKEEIEDLSELLKITSKLLSQVTGFPTIITAPKLGNESLWRIDFILLDKGLLLIIAITKAGTIINRLIKISEEIQADTLSRLSKYLNELLPMMTLEQAREELLRKIEKEQKFLEKVFIELEEDTELPEPIIEGITKLLDFPEFKDIDRLKEILKAFEEKNILLKIIDRCLNTHGVQIFIGEDTGLCRFRDCSAVASPYHHKQQPLGGLAVIGPIRMNYCRVVPAVDYTARILSHLLDKLNLRT